MLPIHILQLAFSSLSTLILWFFAAITFKMDKTSDLNRCFALYNFFLGFGILLYGVYHLLLKNQIIILIVMVTSNFMHNMGFTFLLLSVLVVKFLNFKRIPLRSWIFVLFAYSISVICYFIFPPTLIMSDYNLGIINFNTPFPTLFMANALRVGILFYSTYQFDKIIKFSTNTNTHRKFMYFKNGNLLFIFGLIVNFIGAYLNTLFLEIIGLSCVGITFVIYVYGFRNEIKKNHSS